MNKILLFTTALALFAAPLFGQNIWQKTGGPTGCTVSDFAADSSGNIWVSLNGIVGPAPLFRSADDGQTWLPVPSLPGDISTGNLETAPDGSVYFMPLGLDSIFKTTDGGLSWSSIFIGAPNAFFNRQLVFADDGSMVSSNSGGIVRSQDGGQTWQTVLPLTGFLGVPQIKKAPSGAIWTTMTSLVSGNYELFFSSDNGQAFSQVFAENNASFDEFDLEFSGGFVFFTNINGISRSPDNAANPQFLGGNPQQGQFDQLTVLPNGKLLATDFSDRLINRISDDFGLNWTELPSQSFQNTYFNRHFTTQNGAVLSASNPNETGIWRSVDSGATWQFSTAGIHHAFSHELFASPFGNTIFANGMNGWYRSADMGNNWMRVLNQPTFYKNRPTCGFSPNGDVYIYDGISLFRSQNGGANFVDISPSGGEMTGFAALPDGRLFMTSPFALYQSTNEGFSWVAHSVFPHNFNRYYFKNELEMLGLSGGSNLSRSTDGGQNWTVVDPPTDIWFSSYTENHMTSNGRFFTSDGNHLRYSDDLGLTWNYVNFPSSVQIQSITSNDDGYVFLWSTSFNLLVSDDNGLTFATQPNSGMPNHAYGELAFSNGSLFAGFDYQSVWKTDAVAPTIATITGFLKKDDNGDCLAQPGELPLENWTVSASGPNGEYWAMTDSLGQYRLGYVIPEAGNSSLVLKIHAPNEIWQPCFSQKTVVVNLQDQEAEADFPVDAAFDCPLLTVSAYLSQVKACEQTYLHVNWCNNGSLPAENALLSVKIDPNLTNLTTSLPIFGQNGDTLLFQIGNVGIGKCGNLSIAATVSCAVENSQTLCCAAAISPDSLCFDVPNWSGAELLASAVCDGDSVIDFSIKNIGNANSTAGLEYVVVEDQVVLKTGLLPSITPGDEMLFSELANGTTFLVQAQQEPGHPTSLFTQAWVEGCGENSGGGLSLGFINELLGDDGDPFSAVVCREAVPVFLENFKESAPVGYGAAHFIQPGQPIGYTIHFQNTSGAEVNQVVIRDTVSANLDLATFQLGASSHPVSVEIYGPGIVKFIFRDLKLPDATVDAAGSRGQVSFQISQKTGLPLGSVIHNSATVSFDQRPAVLTNQTWLTVGEKFLTVKIWEPVSKNIELKAWPNPTADAAYFEIKGIGNQPVVLKLFSGDGQLVRQVFSEKSGLKIDRDGLASGLYFFKIETESGQPVGSGKLVIE